MKTMILKTLKDLVADRYLFILLLVLIILSIILSINIGLYIHPSDSQLVSHYSAFGGTQYYYDKWSYLFVFVVFCIVSAILHAIISVKLSIIKGHSLAIMFAWMGIGIVVLGWSTAFALLNLRMVL